MIEHAHPNVAVVGKGKMPSVHLNGKHHKTACTHKFCQNKDDSLDLGRLRARNDVFTDICPRRKSPPWRIYRRSKKRHVAMAIAQICDPSMPRAVSPWRKMAKW
jgi:hypothetical protein